MDQREAAASEWNAEMAFLDWIKERKQAAELKALGHKYGHLLGAPGAAIRHYEKLNEARNENNAKPECDNQKTSPRPRPSWER